MTTVVVVAALFAIYAAGACATIYVGDSGELLTAVHLLGIPHPSGYPLYVLAGKLWTLLLPVGSLAYRMSIFSAACAALTCGIVHRSSRAMGVGNAAAIFAALLLAAGPSLWTEATTQSVYALNALFVVAVVDVAWRWQRRPEEFRLLAAAFFLAGLGACNHTFMLIEAAALSVWALSIQPRLLRRPRYMLSLAASLIAGLAPYLYLPLRSRADPALDWGNPETVGNFLDVVFRRRFWERAWVEMPQDLLTAGSDYLWSLGRELAWVGPILAAVGVIAWGRSRTESMRAKAILLPLLIMLANFVILLLHGNRTDIFVWHRYYIPSYAMCALLAAAGCHALSRRYSRFLPLIALAIPVAAFATGWRAQDRSNYRIGESFARMLLESLPAETRLVAEPDHVLFLLMYQRLVENVRPDVDILLPEGIAGVDPPPLEFDPDRDVVCFTHQPNWRVPGLEIVPVGLVFRAVREGRQWPPVASVSPRLDGELDPRVPKDYLTRSLIGHFHYSLAVSFEERDWLRTREHLQAAADSARDDDAMLYNIGLFYRRNGLFEEALLALHRSHEINPRYVMRRDLPRARDKITEIEAEMQRIARVEAALAADARLAGIATATASWHREMAALLLERKEAVAARGHLRRAAEQESMHL